MIKKKKVAMNKMSNPVTASIILIFAILAFNLSADAGGFTQQLKPGAEAMAKESHIVFLITEDPNNYEAHLTVPKFAEILQKDYGHKVTVLLGTGTHGSYTYPNIEAISKADLLVVFARRIALPHEQMKVIKNYLSSGKPLIGIRTANHAFTPRETVAPGFEDWPGFVADMLGCENRGYGPEQPGTDVSVIPEAAHHPILKNLPSQQWHSIGNVYLVAPLLDKEATVLLMGKVNDSIEPIAWTRTAGKSKVFYTSLGHPSDFRTAPFVALLTGGIEWALDKRK